MPNSLTDAHMMFEGCKLDKESVEKIADSILDVRGISGSHAITIGYDRNEITTEEASSFRDTMAGKGWRVTMQEN